MQLISVLDAPQRTLSFWVRTFRCISTRSLGKVDTRSVNVRAGTVVEPSSSTFAPIQQLIPTSRLVAESRRRPSSVATRTFASTGSVLRGLTARETMFRPCAKFSCKTETFMDAATPPQITYSPQWVQFSLRLLKVYH